MPVGKEPVGPVLASDPVEDPALVAAASSSVVAPLAPLGAPDTFGVPLVDPEAPVFGSVEPLELPEIPLALGVAPLAVVAAPDVDAPADAEPFVVPDWFATVSGVTLLEQAAATRRAAIGASPPTKRRHRLCIAALLVRSRLAPASSNISAPGRFLRTSCPRARRASSATCRALSTWVEKLAFH
jgi:hypothetical protein